MSKVVYEVEIVGTSDDRTVEVVAYTDFTVEELVRTVHEDYDISQNPLDPYGLFFNDALLDAELQLSDLDLPQPRPTLQFRSILHPPRPKVTASALGSPSEGDVASPSRDEDIEILMISEELDVKSPESLPDSQDHLPPPPVADDEEEPPALSAPESTAFSVDRETEDAVQAAVASPPNGVPSSPSWASTRASQGFSLRSKMMGQRAGGEGPRGTFLSNRASMQPSSSSVGGDESAETSPTAPASKPPPVVAVPAEAAPAPVHDRPPVIPVRSDSPVLARKATSPPTTGAKDAMNEPPPVVDASSSESKEEDSPLSVETKLETQAMMGMVKEEPTKEVEKEKAMKPEEEIQGGTVVLVEERESNQESNQEQEQEEEEVKGTSGQMTWSGGPKKEEQEEGGGKGSQKKVAAMQRTQALAIKNPVLVMVEIPEHAYMNTVVVERDGNVSDVLTNLAYKHAIHDVDDFGVFMVKPPEGKRKNPEPLLVKVDKRKPIALIPANPQPHIKLIRAQQRCSVVMGAGKEITLVEPPDVTVRDIERKLLDIAARRVDLSGFVANAAQYALYLPLRTGKGGTVLQMDRTIVSYRLHGEDKLVWKRKAEIPELQSASAQITTAAVQSADAGDTRILVIEAVLEDRTVRGTFKLRASLSVAEVMAAFTKKYPVPNAGQYALYVETTGGEVERLDNLRRLSELPQLRNLSKLEFRRVGAESTTARLRSASALLVVGGFGVDPATMPLVEDLGFQVPSVLRRMRRLLTRLGGLKEEGIFRLSGEEVEMKSLKERLGQSGEEDEEPLLTTNAHNVATLIKRWFNMLPVRLFQNTSDADFRALAEADLEGIARIEQLLSPPFRDLFMWLCSLLVQVSANVALTKMSNANLAVVVAPALASDYRDNPMAGLTMTAKIVAVVQRYLDYRSRLLISSLDSKDSN